MSYEVIWVITVFLSVFILVWVWKYNFKKTKNDKADKYFSKLYELQKLREKNIITEEEFEKEKEKISMK